MLGTGINQGICINSLNPIIYCYDLGHWWIWGPEVKQPAEGYMSAQWKGSRLCLQVSL